MANLDLVSEVHVGTQDEGLAAEGHLRSAQKKYTHLLKDGEETWSEVLSMEERR